MVISVKNRSSTVRLAIDNSRTRCVISEAEWQAGVAGWLPNEADMDFINSLMKPNHAPGHYASWIAPPRMGINQQPVDYEYVKID